MTFSRVLLICFGFMVFGLKNAVALKDDPLATATQKIIAATNTMGSNSKEINSTESIPPPNGSE